MYILTILMLYRENRVSSLDICIYKYNCTRNIILQADMHILSVIEPGYQALKL